MLLNLIDQDTAANESGMFREIRTDTGITMRRVFRGFSTTFEALRSFSSVVLATPGTSKHRRASTQRVGCSRRREPTIG